MQKQHQFPTWMYHKTEPAVIVHTEAQLEALGKGWADSPAAFGVITAPSREQMAEMIVEASEPVVEEHEEKAKKSHKASK